MALDGEVFRIDMAALTGGSTVTVYGQQEVMRDLFDAAEDRGVDRRGTRRTSPCPGWDGDRPSVTWRRDGAEHRLDCDFRGRL
jgi:p-hydroxybenzoate 3-monooxygenase